MARAPSSTTKTRASAGEKLPAKRGSTALTDWQKELAAQAEQAAEMEKGAALGRSFSFKGGQMMFDGNRVEGNRAIVVIADAVIEKAYYDGRYDPDNPEPPACYAFGRDPDTIAPEADKVADLQCETCEECPFNQFGSADTGKGKMCKDSRRLLLIPAGKYVKDDIECFDDPKYFEKAEMAMAKIPPTSLQAYATFVRQVSGTMQRPPHGIFAEMICEPDSKVQFRVTFEPIDEVPDHLMPAIMARHKEAAKIIAQPYTYPSEEERRQAPKGRTAKKPVAKSGATRGAAAKATGGRRKY